MSERNTGLNSYVLRLPNGEYAYDQVGKVRGYGRDTAWIWLCEPEAVDGLAARVGILAAKAERARP